MRGAAKRQKLEGRPYEDHKLCFRGFCDINGPLTEALEISDKNDQMQFIVKFTTQNKFYEDAFASNTPLVPDLARIAASYLPCKDDKRVQMEIYVKGLPETGWVRSIAFAGYLEEYVKKPSISPSLVKVPPSPSLPLVPSLPSLPGGAPPSFDSDDDFDDMRPAPPVAPKGGPISILSPPQPRLTSGKVELQPWQVSSAKKTVEVLSKGSEPDPRFSIVRYGNVSMNPAGWISQEPGIELPFEPPKIKVSLAVIREETGVGKTFAALYFIILWFARTSSTQEPTQQPQYVHERKHLERTVVLLVPCDTVESWEKSVRDMFPDDVCCVTLVNERSLQGLNAVLGTHREGITVLIVSFDVLFCAKTTPKATRLSKTKTNSMDPFKNIVVDLVIIDEAHNLWSKHEVPVKYKKPNEIAINRNVRVVRHYFNAKRYVVLSASMRPDDELSLYQCLALCDTNHSFQGHFVNPQPFYAAVSTKEVWRSYRVPDFAFYAMQILLNQWISTGATHPRAMTKSLTIQYNVHPLWSHETLKDIVPLRYLYTLRQLLREKPYKQGDPDAFQYMLQAINEIEEFYPNTTTRNPLFPYKPALLDLFFRTNEKGKEIGGLNTDVPYEKHKSDRPMLTREHALLNAIKLIWETEPKSAILVYDPSSNDVQPMCKWINGAGIPCTLQIGNIHRVQKALRDFETQDKSCVMIIGRNHTEGTNMPKLTHVLVVDAENMVESHLQQVVGRGTRFGRKGQVTVVCLNGV